MTDAIFFDIIDAQLTAAGLLGGLIHAFRAEKVTPWNVIKSVITGGMAANFIAPQVFRVMTILPPELIAFGIGMSGKHLCSGLEKFFDKLDVLWRTKNE